MTQTANHSNNQQETTPLYHGAQNHCFGCGTGNPVGLHLTFSVAPDGAVLCDAIVSSNYEGPPGCLHGGIIATLLDEAMSKANRAGGVTAMTRQMQIEYLRPVPSESPIRITGRVIRSEGRKHWTEASIQNGDGTKLAAASALFIAVRQSLPAGNSFNSQE
ncbi:PaaI family thioesterase [Acidicapsa dinghuensis]|uniref:Acyl-coenzyme A thioesterase THEM4 n=1 Tax=Acidicapsa dinghuensis TaxID=2218256 RepID=A0ABW1ELR5_9BACT|nr:PaaI family thioesterase [Acidicapsa dinghuensis]